MDKLSFISNIVNSLAWPTVVVISFFLLRNQIEQLIPRISKMKLKDAEIEFSTAIKRLEKEIKSSKLPFLDDKKSSKHQEVANELEVLANEYPRFAILESWSLIEYNLGQYAYKSQTITQKENIYAYILYHEIAKQLFKNDNELFKLYNELRMLRNMVIHDHNFIPTTENAKAFISIALNLLSAIDERKERLASQ